MFMSFSQIRHVNACMLLDSLKDKTHPNNIRKSGSFIQDNHIALPL